MRDKKYYVMDSESKNIEYELIIDDTEEDKVVLRHANSESVSSECRGEVILTATDSGNGRTSRTFLYVNNIFLFLG